MGQIHLLPRRKGEEEGRVVFNSEIGGFRERTHLQEPKFQ